MREIFVESEHQEFQCPPGFVADGGAVSVGEPLTGGRSRTKPLFMHRLLAPEELTQEALFVFRNWKGRRCYPHPDQPESPLWWVVDGEPERFLVIEGERRKARLTQIPTAFPTVEGPAVFTEAAPTVAEAADHPDFDRGDRLPDSGRLVLPVEKSEEHQPVGADAGATATAGGRWRDDPFKRSLDAVLAELTSPIAQDTERQARVAVRVVPAARDAEGPMSLPSRPELVSGDFLTHAELGRPALAPLEPYAADTRFRLSNRAFAILAGALAAFLSLAFWLFH